MIKDATTPQKALHFGGGMLAALFISLGGINLLTADFLDAGIWLALGAALLALGAESTSWSQIPLWRRLLGSALTLVGVGALAVRLWLDFSA